MTAARRLVLIALALTVAAVALLRLEGARSGVEIRPLRIGETPATLYLPEGAERPPVAVVAHGFSGSRRMMEAISLSLARSGVAALAFDFRGHGLHPEPMSPDVTAIEGTTAGLVAQTLEVIEAAAARGEVVALVGHSMATDVILRANLDRPVGRLVTISTYSDTVTATTPEALLLVSGAFEWRLRDVALGFVRQVDPLAEEGVTAAAGEVRRRAVAAPLVGHVGVLWSPTTLRETVAWVGGAEAGGIARTGPWIALLLGALVLGYRPVASGLPAGPAPPGLSVLRFGAAVVAAGAGAAAAGLTLGAGVGLAGMGALAGSLAGWGGAALVVLGLSGRGPGRVPWTAVAACVTASLLFALALDRYGAAFLPTGPRLPLLALWLPAALPFALADAHLAWRVPLWRRAAMRLGLLSLLGGLMALRPDVLGLNFTALPVLALWFLVFGSLGRWTARRAGPTAAGLALAPALAWSLAAALPRFAAG